MIDKYVAEVLLELEEEKQNKEEKEAAATATCAVPAPDWARRLDAPT